ncbi:hypothetical protein ACFL67_01135 [candidate division KSB1 bacterium]
MDILDKLIVIGIILLILSLINEKITQLFRKYLPHANEIPLLKLFFRDSPVKENAEKEIMLLSIFTGILVAFFSNADLFLLIRAADPTSVLFTAVFTDTFNVNNAIGIIFTGIFLSFGSKFFHDLIDTLLQVKNLKRKLNDEKTYKIQNIDELEKYLKLSDYDLAQKAVEENRESIIKLKNVAAFGLGTDENDNYCAEVHLKDDDDSEIEKSLKITIPGGQIHTVNVKIIKGVGETKVHNTVNPGNAIGNMYNRDEVGTLGCVVQHRFKKSKYFLTCYHAVNAGHDWDLFQPVDKERVVAYHDGRPEIGDLIYGRRDKYLDVALIKPDTDIQFNEAIIGIEKPDGVRDLTPVDYIRRTKVKFKGRTSEKIKTGKVVNINFTLSDIKYPDDNHELQDMIVLSKPKSGGSCSTVSEPGDSGSLVVDENNKGVGIIVAGNDQFTYAIPLKRILDFVYMDLA